LRRCGNRFSSENDEEDMKYVDRRTEAPLCAVSTRSSLENRTGTWRFARPVFVDRVSPCNRKCPAGEDIAGTLYLAGLGQYEDAWRLIMRENPFPAIMGRVCYHTCEQSCNRAKHDEPVSIHTVERFLGDLALVEGFPVEPPPEARGGRVAVVGAGPAGLSAAYFLRRLGHNVTVFDAKDSPGGLMRYGIPAYRLPVGVLDGELERLREMGIVFETGRVLGQDLSWDGVRSAHEAVFLAVGAHGKTRLKLEGIELAGVFGALDFLESVSEGGSPGTGEKVAVIGGGNSAVDCARVCRRLGAEVSVFYRRTEAEMPAHAEEVAAAREEGVSFQFLCAPERIVGAGRVAGIRLSRMRLGEPDDSGRGRPEPTGETLESSCTSVITAMGESPDMELLAGILGLEGGALEADEFGRTGLPGVFVGGDLAPVPRTVTHAVGSGKRAAAAIDAFLRKEPPHGDSLGFRWGEGGNIALGSTGGAAPFFRRNPVPDVVGYEDLNPFYFDRRPSCTPRELESQERVKGFEEVVQGPAEQEALAEALRCFVCGACTSCGNCYIFCPDLSVRKDSSGFGYVVDLDYCKGCGICVKECPRGAMTIAFEE
jgi:NADPH-dependent glutamate synthase beta subunit-like oxidoreductase/NAD-dependent dihydropyrimidine dehydrogenase PreA subunit